MTEMVRFRATDSLNQSLRIDSVEIEDLAELRYIHTSAFRLASCHYLTEAEIGRFSEYANSPDYSDALFGAIRRKQLFGARIDNRLVGTAGWVHADGPGATARLQWLFVRPMFTDCGIGRQLVSATELNVMRSGFEVMAARSVPSTTNFLEHLGYAETSRGVLMLTEGLKLPTTYMKKRLVHSGINHLTRH